MKNKLSVICVSALAIISLIGCGSSTTPAPEETISVDTGSTNSDINLDLSNTDATTESAQKESEPDEATSSESASEETSSNGYTAEDAERMFRNYMLAELTNVDFTGVEVYVDLSDGKYWIDTFKDNETESMHPVKCGSAYIDQMTGIGKFWLWGSYNDPDAVDVDFSKYDY